MIGLHRCRRLLAYYLRPSSYTRIRIQSYQRPIRTLSTLRRPHIIPPTSSSSSSSSPSCCSSLPYPAAAPAGISHPAQPSSSSSITTTITADLLPRISSHPALRSIQVRCGPRATYRPCHRIRKRRFGFLARLKTRGGRKIIKRRRTKGRVAISH